MKVVKEIPFGDRTLVLETGEIARFATAAVVASMDGTMVLVTVVAEKELPSEARDFFPLTVNYMERTYAAGRIPGGFLKREGRPSEIETLTSRLIDRPIRPLFPEGFKNEVQVVAKVLSLNPDVNADIVAMIGASAALSIAGVPFQGPIGAARVGYQDGVYQLNPTPQQVEDGSLNLVVAGTEKAILMVESEAKELSEDVMLGAVLYGHEMMQSVIKAIREMADEVGNESWTFEAPSVDQHLQQRIRDLSQDAFANAYLIKEKAARSTELQTIRKNVLATLLEENEDVEQAQAKEIVSQLEKTLVRDRILNGEPRIDGRTTTTVRPISVRTGVLPRAHGSALFTRGETQALVVATLGNERDAQILDSLTGESRDRFMLHYNFPPYCVGETGMMGSPKRREIGHGRLARRALEAVLPNEEQFPYVIRVVSEITESNGSSSMASVCGTSLALMDAGVSTKAPVAGIAMGLIKEGDKFAVLTDILGDEDHLGDMDFKVAGTSQGVTALQMDIKIDGITKDIMQQALNQALDGRQHILGVMNQVLEQPRDHVSEFAPRFHSFKIHPDKIRDVIGKGGATIRGLTESTGVSIDINDDGLVTLFSPDKSSADLAMEKIKEITADVEVGRVYLGTVQRIVDFGAFVNILPNRDGLVHISEIAHERVENVKKYLFEGQKVDVKVLDVDRQGRIKLSIKALLDKPEQQPAPEAESAAADQPTDADQDSIESVDEVLDKD